MRTVKPKYDKTAARLLDQLGAQGATTSELAKALFRKHEYKLANNRAQNLVFKYVRWGWVRRAADGRWKATPLFRRAKSLTHQKETVS